MAMKVRSSPGELSVSPETRRLIRQTVSPLCGLAQAVYLALYDRLGPHFFVAAGDLTGVHVLLNQPKPRSGVYHIGGSGVVLEEALIRTLGESVERYTQLLAGIHFRGRVQLASYRQMAARGECVLPFEQLRLFSPAQYAKAGFPFQPFSEDSLLGWVQVASIRSEHPTWVPAQCLFVGYAVHAQGEPWVFPAVTTGSAAHRNYASALHNALLELIQIDSAMGHWYTGATAARIELDQRTAALERLMQRQFEKGTALPQFYWLPNADLPGLTVACVLKGKPGTAPAAAVGLGCDLKLKHALYKALLECVGVAQMAKLTLLDNSMRASVEEGYVLDLQHIYDLDRNVAYYALPKHSAPVFAKFDERQSIKASELPPDVNDDIDAQNRLLLKGFLDSGKELVAADLTTRDCKQIGFVALRVWSPDTLSLCIPSAPPAAHPRFQAYGGFQNDRPHPYP